MSLLYAEHAPGHGRELARHGLIAFLNIKMVRLTSQPQEKTRARANE